MPPTRRRRTPVPPVEETTEVAPLVEDAPAPAQISEPSEAETAAAIAAIAGAGLTTVDAAVVLSQAGAVLGVEVDPAVEVAPEPPTRFVRARHAELGVEATLARTALADWPGWEAIKDVPDSETPLLPAHTTD